MLEKLSESYEQSLEEFVLSQANYKTVTDQLKKIKREAQSQYLKLQLAIYQLNQLRHHQVFTIMEEKGLGICSAEIIPEELKLKHKDIKKTSELEKLGLFPKGKLRFIYFHDRRWSKGGHYESGNYYNINYVLSLCPHHFPKEVSFLSASVFSHEKQSTDHTESLPYWEELITKEDSLEPMFVSKKTGEQPWTIHSFPEYKFSPLPETVFKYFQIPPIPELPKEPR